MTMTGTTTTAPYDELSAQLRGRLVRPHDADYDEVRAVYNGMIDKRPAAVVQCRDAFDVSCAIRFARKHGLETRRTAPCASTAAARGTTSTTPRSASGWPRRPGSSAPRAWAA